MFFTFVINCVNAGKEISSAIYRREDSLEINSRSWMEDNEMLSFGQFQG